MQVYCIGIANPDVEELRFISSEPDEEHVFLLDSYNDATSFVDFISIQICDCKWIICGKGKSCVWMNGCVLFSFVACV